MKIEKINQKSKHTLDAPIHNFALQNSNRFKVTMQHLTVENIKTDIASWLEYYDFLGQTINETMFVLDQTAIMESFFSKYILVYNSKKVFDPSKVVTLPDYNTIYDHEDVFIGLYRFREKALTVSMRCGTGVLGWSANFNYEFPIDS